LPFAATAVERRPRMKILENCILRLESEEYMKNL
jgi:hypothetical protein